MKNNIRLKSLISISLLIFVLPFLQTCSDKTLKSSPAYAGEFTGFVQDSVNFKIVYNKETNSNDTLRNLIAVSKSEKEKIIKKEKADKEIWLKKAKKENTLNAYRLGFLNYSEFEFRYLKDKTFYIFLNFTFIILLTLIMLIISFKKMYKQIMIISSISISLLFIATISLYFMGAIEDLNQIKYGYYLFVVNSILIILESRKEINKHTE
ncbi:hypothetical protein ABGT15_14655 [Flavobacterium enshiense]|uniref:hypothetical protein n=1 Tax=Flavobacterium enshiense TaxID=1341165 RepID=UPI00345CEE0E